MSQVDYVSVLPEAYIFDIDGTLANVEHRIHYVRSTPPDWDAFFEAMVDDELMFDVAQLARTLHAAAGTNIILTTGRPEKYRYHTLNWLAKHKIKFWDLHMRADDDIRSDVEVKKEMLAEITKNFHVRLVIDDRQSVVDMWREEGLTCLQCIPDWEGETKKPSLHDSVKGKVLLTLMVGPSGAGKSTLARQMFDPACIVSSDDLRRQLLGETYHTDDFDEHGQSLVWFAMHEIIAARLKHSLFTVVDATNIRDADRKSLMALLPEGVSAQYIVVNRDMEIKRADGGWRNILDHDIIAKHEDIFQSNKKAIMKGDGFSNVNVLDMSRLA